MDITSGDYGDARLSASIGPSGSTESTPVRGWFYLGTQLANDGKRTRTFRSIGLSGRKPGFTHASPAPSIPRTVTTISFPQPESFVTEHFYSSFAAWDPLWHTYMETDNTGLDFGSPITEPNHPIGEYSRGRPPRRAEPPDKLVAGTRSAWNIFPVITTLRAPIDRTESSKFLGPPELSSTGGEPVVSTLQSTVSTRSRRKRSVDAESQHSSELSDRPSRSSRQPRGLLERIQAQRRQHPRTNANAERIARAGVRLAAAAASVADDIVTRITTRGSVPEGSGGPASPKS
nr:TPA_asm: hypothetical protein [Denlac tricladivirus]